MKRVVFSSPGFRPVRASLVLAAALCAGIDARASAQISPTFVRAISSSVVGSEAVITIEANGPLPAPTVGTLDGPPRIFLDFPGVRTQTSGLVRTSDRRILRVRVAINSVSPLVTRVVLDLAAQQPHRIEQATGRVMIFVGATSHGPGAPPPPPLPAVVETPPAVRRSPPHVPARSTRPPPPATAPPATAPPATIAPPVAAPATTTEPAIPPVPPLPEPPPTPAKPAVTPEPGPRTPTPDTASSSGGSSGRGAYRTPSPPSKDVERYRTQVSGVLQRLRNQQPLLESVELLEEQMPARMQSAMDEFDYLRQELSAVKPPETLKQQHELLMQATRLGSTAARLRFESTQSSDRAVVRNAASAAAGAILMLNRACADLGCPNPPGR